MINKKLSIAKAGRRLHLKPSTAKLIVKKFKETGIIDVRRSKKDAEMPSRERKTNIADKNQIIVHSQPQVPSETH